MSPELINHCRTYLLASANRHVSKAADFVEWVIKVSAGLITPSVNELEAQFAIAPLWIGSDYLYGQETVSRIRDCLDSILSRSTSSVETKKTDESLTSSVETKKTDESLTSSVETKKTDESDEDFVKLMDIGSRSLFLLKNSISRSLFLLKNSIGCVFIYKDDCYQYIGVLNPECRTIEYRRYSDVVGKNTSESVPQWSIKNYSHYLEVYTNDINKYRRLLLLVRSNVDTPNRYVNYPDMTEDDNDELIQLYNPIYLWKGTDGILFCKNEDSYSSIGRLSSDCKSVIPINCNHSRVIIDDNHCQQVINTVINYAHPDFAESVKKSIKPQYIIDTAIFEDDPLPNGCSIIHMGYDNYIVIKPEVKYAYILEELVNFTIDNQNMSVKNIINHIDKTLNA